MVLFTFIRLQNDISDGDRTNTFLMYFLRASLKRGHINKKLNSSPKSLQS